MAGQGTAGLEIVEDAPQVTDVIVSIGGGGLIGGVATAVKSRRPDVRVWGVETEGADCMAQALAANAVVTMGSITSIARTLGAPAASEETLAAVQRYVESRDRGERRGSDRGAPIATRAHERCWSSRPGPVRWPRPSGCGTSLVRIATSCCSCVVATSAG